VRLVARFSFLVARFWLLVARGWVSFPRKRESRVFLFFIFHFSFFICCSATFSQVLHPISGREIWLDDFPVLVPGYRLQVGAFNSQKTANQLKQQFQSKISAKVHLRQEGGKWLVRVGDFRDSTLAHELSRSKSFATWSGKAVLVDDQIPVNPDSLPPPPVVPGYRLQVYALTDSIKAVTSGRDLTGLFPDLRVHVILVDSLYKVQLGDFKDSIETLTWKDKITGTADLQPIIIPMEVWNLPPPKPAMSPPRDIFKYDD
jgi:hypothetical protein